MYKTLKNIENTPIKKVDIMNININDKVIIHYKSLILIEDIHFKYKLRTKIIGSEEEVAQSLCEALSLNYFLKEIRVFPFIVLGVELTAHSDS